MFASAYRDVGDNYYNVWIAHLDAGLNLSPGTPSLYTNARYLQQQINQVAELEGEKVVLVAHSMGGLVSRACLRVPGCRKDVRALYTLGSPHAGFNSVRTVLAWARVLVAETDGGIGCAPWLAVVCEMASGYYDPEPAASSGMALFNHTNPWPRSVSLHMIGGVGGGSPPPIELLALASDGPNDGIVGYNSAVGFPYPQPVIEQSVRPVAEFELPEWSTAAEGGSNALYPKRMVTTESHTDDWGDSYIEPWLGSTSLAFECIHAIEQGSDLPNECEEVTSPLVGTAAGDSQPVPVLTDVGLVHASEAVTLTVPVEASGLTEFAAYMSATDLDFALRRPDGIRVDAEYASLHPAEVTWTEVTAGALNPPGASAVITEPLAGDWLMELGAGGQDASYAAFVTTHSDVDLSLASDTLTYEAGTVAAITATLGTGGNALEDVTIDLVLARPSGATEEVAMDAGPGQYTASLPVGAEPGHSLVTAVARAVRDGQEIRREAALVIAVTPSGGGLTGTASGDRNDANGDGIYDWLIASVGVTTTAATTFTLSAHLTADGALVSQSATEYFAGAPGTHVIDIEFPGDDIRAARIDGPYSVDNVAVSAVEEVSVPMDTATHVWVSPAWSWSEFGSFPRGDCNSDLTTNAGDLSALVLEIFDADGTNPLDAHQGSFAGRGDGCDANTDEVINAGDLSCLVLLIFNGRGACPGATS
jgi:pimeloyl-ACP methyl ester carboxylesterase